jgi:hypothetical protein
MKISAACATSYNDFASNAIADILDADPDLSDRVVAGDEKAEALCWRAEKAALAAVVAAFPRVIRPADRERALEIARMAAKWVIATELS